LKRKRYQAGSLHRKKRTRGSDVWILRYREWQASGTTAHRSIIVGTVDQYSTKTKAQKAAEALRLSLNADYVPTSAATVGTLVDRYILEALPERYSTSQSYRSYLNGYIKPQWGDHDLVTLGRNPFWVEKWLRELPNAPKTKAHIRSLMHRLYEYAMKWRMISIQRNPMELVEVKGASKRMRKPKVLTVQQYHLLLPLIPEPYRTMVVIAQCLGLRVSEILGLQWRDLDFEGFVLRAQRGVVQGRVDRVKSEYSEDDVPLDSAVAAVLQDWQETCPATEEGWLFPNPTTNKPYHASEICKNYIRPAGEKLGLGKIGWHTFRHTYRTLLDETCAPMKVQQELMRHANIQTTMNVYGSAMLESKRTANSKIVRMVLIPAITPGKEKGRAPAAP
jgi:integrase